MAPALTTDCAIFDGAGRVLLIRRRNPPFKGAYALPGGFVELDESVDAACRREVLEEAGIELGDLRLVGVYSDPGRDPRGHTVSVAFSAVLTRAQPRRPDLTPRQPNGSPIGESSRSPSTMPRSSKMPRDLQRGARQVKARR